MKKLIILAFLFPLIMVAQETTKTEVYTFNQQGFLSITPKLTVVEKVDGTKVVYKNDKNGIQNITPSLYYVPSLYSPPTTSVYRVYKGDLNGFKEIMPLLEIRTFKRDTL